VSNHLGEGGIASRLIGSLLEGDEMRRDLGERCLLACALVALLSAPGDVVCADSSVAGQDRGSLVIQALRAKQLGKASLELTVTLDRPVDERFDSIKSEWSFFVATRTTRPPIAVAGPDFIYTWHILRLERSLSAPAASQRACGGDVPKVVQLEAGEIAVPVLGGAATVEGVAVTMTSRTAQASFEVGRRYLFIGALCPGQVASLPYADSSVIPVSSVGTIGPSGAPYPFTFVGEIVGFTRLAELERRLRGQR
jgi:hypothetical protein